MTDHNKALSPGFFAKLFSREDLNGGGTCPTYMVRRTLLRLPFGMAVYLHHYLTDDWSRDLHDHPKRFWSIGLWGGYIEEYLEGWPSDNHYFWNYVKFREFHAPWIRTFPATHIHRLRMPVKYKTRLVLKGAELKVIPEPEVQQCWTLCIVGPTVREWGWYHNSVWIKAEHYWSDKVMVARVKIC